VARHMADPDAVAKEVDGMPSLNAGGLEDHAALHAAGNPTGGLTSAERGVAERMGLDPEKFALQKAGKLEPPKKGGK